MTLIRISPPPGNPHPRLIAEQNELFSRYSLDGYDKISQIDLVKTKLANLIEDSLNVLCFVFGVLAHLAAAVACLSFPALMLWVYLSK